jgi:hypothetical protein
VHLVGVAVAITARDNLLVLGNVVVARSLRGVGPRILEVMTGVAAAVVAWCLGTAAGGELVVRSGWLQSYYVRTRLFMLSVCVSLFSRPCSQALQ